ncbi:MAG: DNA-binding protein [Microcoleus sp. PH2017_10_PVI_O_A]|nr:DNA-binding protein [Microcoleus sp. PH2017_10_PVI_O_A]MCC3460945.1 DNA-binding protein [Microcoleus sp. PH2017_11_PCY_U_A]MCC3479467.1 DNA-binding protein [Microcoleus sp. PH2017_12_PCY_D_A]MCC3560309.1 DNA-binding protein [Microcoleus sp. PH2017_27_LUM_O_A]TAE82319.1 MAG: DNA-binding protein [Oscillatoriales cyanobacterium]
MKTITITIPDERLLKLQETASSLGISLEALLLMSAENLLVPPETSFENAMEYVLKKNAELYKKLA